MHKSRVNQGFLMAEDLNGYISSVFTREDISSLPVPDATFQEAKSDYLGQLIVTLEMEAKKIKATKDNESPGMDGIPPRLIMETVKQISIPLARVFNFLKARSCLKNMYFIGRNHQVERRGITSRYYIPQGSILGPLLF